MKYPVFFTFAVALAGAAVAGPDLPAPQGPAIVAANLDTMRIPGKIDGVLWTRRTHVYTLQVLIPAARGSRSTAMPDIDAWLVRGDGSRIDPVGKLAHECPRFGRCAGGEAEFTFGLTAGREAVAAAVRIGEESRTERLTRFPD